MTEESTTLGLHTLQVNNEKKHEALNKIDVGTKVKCLFAEPDLLPSENSKIIVLKFYVSSVSYLQNQLPFDKFYLKHVQYIHPKKRLDPGSTSATSNIALNIGRVMKNCLQSVFGVSSSETVEGLCDSISTQWQVCQTKLILEDWYKNRSEESASSSLQTQHSYWECALSVCMMEPVSTIFESYFGMDKFWQKVGTMADSAGSFKYP